MNIHPASTNVRSRSMKVSYGSAGVGSISHFGCVMLLSAIKQEIAAAARH